MHQNTRADWSFPPACEPREYGYRRTEFRGFAPQVALFVFRIPEDYTMDTGAAIPYKRWVRTGDDVGGRRGMMNREKKSLSYRKSAAYSPRETEENTWLQGILNQCGEWREGTHGFHAYPGRMHPAIPAQILAGRNPEEGKVLDPFCGSGTTLVEAVSAGFESLGNDTHPLAVRIARLKSSRWTEEQLSELRQVTLSIGSEAEEMARSKAKSAHKRRSHPDEAKWFPPHVRYELSNLLHGISYIDDWRTRDAAELILSSILIKVSHRRSDSNSRVQERNLRRGQASQFYLRRAEELVGQLRHFTESVQGTPGRPEIRAGDARNLHWVEDQSVQCVVTSPPYLGTYDYFSHQAIRSAVLGIEDRQSRRNEIGSRSRAEEEEGPLRRWENDLRDVLNELARVCKEGADAFFVIGTSRLKKRIIENDKLMTVLAKDHGFVVQGVASQDMLAPDSSGDSRKSDLRETLIWLKRDDRPFPEHLRRRAPNRSSRSEDRRGRETGRSERRPRKPSHRSRSGNNPSPYKRRLRNESEHMETDSRRERSRSNRSSPYSERGERTRSQKDRDFKGKPDRRKPRRQKDKPHHTASRKDPERSDPEDS